MEKQILAGGKYDRRWPAPINPDEPQAIKPTPKKNDVLKKVRSENSALKIKLDDVITKNADLIAENKKLLNNTEELNKEIKSLKEQLTKAKKEAVDVIKTIEKKSPVSRKSTRKTQV